MKLQRGRRPNRAGYVLVMFVMLLFGLMGLAALIIDVGFARLAQRQMQSAIDSAALEGTHWQSSSASDPLLPRQQASQIVGDLFTNSVDSSGGTIQYGAGPVVNMTGGDSQLAASQLMSPGSPPDYQPATSGGTAGLELNESNATEGDIVEGTYNPGEPSAEADNYARADFTPTSGTASTTSSAFLVRMRRTNNLNGLDQEAGTSSGGPTLPILFGRGSMMARSGTGSQLSASSGITVRATAIAGPQPAKTVGPLYTNSGGTLTAIAQLAPFAVNNTLWTQVSGGSAATVVTIPNADVLLLSANFSSSLTAIGQQLSTTSDTSVLASASPSAVYVPVYADYASQSATIIGFVYCNWSYSGTGGTLTLTPAAATVQIGAQNVSPTMALPLPASLATADAATMFQDHASLFTQNPLYAPALVNRYIGSNPSIP